MNDFGGRSYPAPEQLAQEERTWGIFGHISPIITSFFCLTPLGPLIVWLIQKDKSRFASRAGLEALAFSLGIFVAAIVLFVLGTALACIGIGVIFYILAMPLWFVMLFYNIVGAIHASNGRYFEYPLTSGFLPPAEAPAAPSQPGAPEEPSSGTDGPDKPAQ